MPKRIVASESMCQHKSPSRLDGEVLSETGWGAGWGAGEMPEDLKFFDFSTGIVAQVSDVKPRIWREFGNKDCSRACYI